MSDELAEIRRGVSGLHTALALHDQKVDSNVARIADAQDRMANAVEKIGEATVAIRTLAEKVEANGKRNGFTLDRKTIVWLIGLGLGGATALGGGQEIAHRVFHAFLGGAQAETAAPEH